MLGCSLESKHQLAPQATDSPAHLPLTSLAAEHLYCQLCCSPASLCPFLQAHDNKMTVWTGTEEPGAQILYSG